MWLKSLRNTAVFFQKDVSNKIQIYKSYSSKGVFCDFYSLSAFFMDSVFIIGVKLA